MATFEIMTDTRSNEKILTAAPDCVLGASDGNAFVWSTVSDGTLDAWHYDEFDIRSMISSLSKKIIHKHEAEVFMNILLDQVHNEYGF